MKTYNINQLQSLIDAFYRGETTVEQEQALLNYFESKNVEQELLNEKELFLRMYEPEPVEVLAHLENRLSNLIDELAEKEKKTIGIQDSKQNKNRMWIWTGSAACIVILIFAGFFLNNQRKREIPTAASVSFQSRDTFTDPKEAQAETLKALILLSSNFNKGVSRLSLISSSMEKTNRILNKTFTYEN